MCTTCVYVCMTICVCMPIKESPDQSAPCCPCPAKLAAWLFHSHQSCNIKTSKKDAEGGMVRGDGDQKKREKKWKKWERLKERLAVYRKIEIVPRLRDGLFLFCCRGPVIWVADDRYWSVAVLHDGSGWVTVHLLLAPIKVEAEWNRQKNWRNDWTIPQQRQTEKERLCTWWARNCKLYMVANTTSKPPFTSAYDREGNCFPVVSDSDREIPTFCWVKYRQ